MKLPLASRVFVDELNGRDAEAVAGIHAEGFPHPWSADEFRALAADRAILGLAARRESFLGWRRLAGFILVRRAADEAEVLTVAVRAAQRGRGIGRKLLEEVLRRLYRDGITTCFLEVDRDNGSAIRLYRALGFETVGERKGYYRRAGGDTGSALVMRVAVR